MSTSPSRGRLVGPHSPAPTRPVTPIDVTPTGDVVDLHERTRRQMRGEDPHDLEQARIDHELQLRDRRFDYADDGWPTGDAA